MKRLDAMALVCLVGIGLWPHPAESVGRRGRPVNFLQLGKAVQDIRDLRNLSGDDFANVHTGLAGHLGRILRDLGVEVLPNSSEQKLGRKLIRERKTLVDALVRSGKLSKEKVEILVPILNELSLLRPILTAMDKRIAGAVEQARMLRSLTGDDFSKIQIKLASRVGRILRDLGVEVPPDSSVESLGGALVRERQSMIDALERRGQLSHETAEVLAPILSELALLRPIGKIPVDTRIAAAVERLRALRRLDGKEFTRAQTKLAGRLGRILRDLGVEVTSDSSADSLGRKLMRDREAMIDGLVLSGKLSKESAEKLTPIAEQLSLLRLLGVKLEWTPAQTTINPDEALRKLRVWQILKGRITPEGHSR